MFKQYVYIVYMCMHILGFLGCKCLRSQLIHTLAYGFNRTLVYEGEAEVVVGREGL